MPSARPTLSTKTSWPSPTANNSEVNGANGSARLMLDFPASASGAIVAACLQRPTGEIAIDEAVVVGGGFALGLPENLLVLRRQRTGGIGVAGIPGQRKGLAAAAAEIDFPELAALAWLRHPGGAAIAVEGFRVLPDPGNRVVRSHRLELETGNAFRGMAGQDLARR